MASMTFVTSPLRLFRPLPTNREMNHILKTDGFSKDKDHGYVKPFKIDAVASWKQDLVIMLDSIVNR
jgi:hypothetical protein